MRSSNSALGDEECRLQSGDEEFRLCTQGMRSSDSALGVGMRSLGDEEFKLCIGG